MKTEVLRGFLIGTAVAVWYILGYRDIALVLMGVYFGGLINEHTS